ncbi:MAG: nitroreductase [Sphingomonadaceae bacterium]
MLNDRSSPLSLLRTRRSARPRDLVAPGPDEAQLREILEIAARAPDHGKLAPWRFVHIADRDAFEALLVDAHALENPDPRPAQLEAVTRFARQAPTLIALVSSPVEGTKIPLWEQRLSCGAAGMNLVHAVHALGFAAGWVTGWAAYSEKVRGALCGQGGRVAGFIFIGTPANELEERERPALDEVTRRWP